MAAVEVVPVDHGWLVRPGTETADGVPRVVPRLGYLVWHPRGTLLLDTGIGRHPDTDAHYRPRSDGVHAALAGVGSAVADVDVVVNCHLHFDHCGGNPEFTHAPVVVQSAELEAARGIDYTLPGLVDVSGEASEVGGLAGGRREYLSGVGPVVRPWGLRPLR